MVILWSSYGYLMVILWLSYGHLMVVHSKSLREEREVHIAIFAFFEEMRVRCKIVVGRMLQNKQSVLGKELCPKNQVWQGGQFIQCVGRVCKNEVEFLPASRDELESISANDGEVFGSELLGGTDDEVLLCVCHFHRYNICGSAAGALQTDAACPSKQVEDIAALDLYLVLQKVEKTLLSEISSGSCRDVFWRIQPSAFPFAAYDTHVCKRG